MRALKVLTEGYIQVYETTGLGQSNVVFWARILERVGVIWSRTLVMSLMSLGLDAVTIAAAAVRVAFGGS